MQQCGNELNFQDFKLDGCIHLPPPTMVYTALSQKASPFTLSFVSVPFCVGRKPLAISLTWRLVPSRKMPDAWWVGQLVNKLLTMADQIHPSILWLMGPGKNNGYYDPAAPRSCLICSYDNIVNYSVSCLKRNEALERFGNLPQVTQPSGIQTQVCLLHIIMMTKVTTTVLTTED